MVDLANVNTLSKAQRSVEVRTAVGVADAMREMATAVNRVMRCKPALFGVLDHCSGCSFS
jgi:hypothetical protein